jgi:hypothetical protein
MEEASMRRVVGGWVVGMCLVGCRTTQTSASAEAKPDISGRSILVDRNRIPHEVANEPPAEAPVTPKQSAAESPAPSGEQGVGGSGPNCDAEQLTGEELDANGCPDE